MYIQLKGTRSKTREREFELDNMSLGRGVTPIKVWPSVTLPGISVVRCDADKAEGAARVAEGAARVDDLGLTAKDPLSLSRARALARSLSSPPHAADVSNDGGGARGADVPRKGLTRHSSSPPGSPAPSDSAL